MQKTPLVTVYIATHNRADLLLRAVESVLAQTYANLELIVADDGSIDNTFTVLVPFIESGRLSYVKNDVAKGACSARNLAIEIAKGEFITGLDDDDEFLPDRVTHLLSLIQDSDYSCVASPYRERTPSGDVDRRFDCGEITLDDLLHANLLGNQVMTRTSFLRKIGGFDPLMPAFQDYDTWVRLVQNYGHAFKSDHISYLWYTDHVSGRISDSSEKRLRAYGLFMAKHKQLMSPAHFASMKILDKRLRKQSYSLLEFIRLSNKGNFKASFSLFVNSNLVWLKWLLDVFRTKKL